MKKQLFDLLREKGAVLMGVADLRGIVPHDMTTGVAVAVPVPKAIVEDLKTAPTEAYYQLYHSLNAQLNDIVETGAAYLRTLGYQAQAQTTDFVQTDDAWRSPLPHKTVATNAGLGWIGKNCLLVTQAYGSAIRLSSLVTNAPLPCDSPIVQSQCGDCTRCVDACPARALKGAVWQRGMARETLFDRVACKEMQLERMRRATGIEADLCGLCFAVCPYTQAYLDR